MCGGGGFTLRLRMSPNVDTEQDLPGAPYIQAPGYFM